MTRNFKVLGLALFALFAMSAIIAQVASAANGKLTSDGPVTLTGTETGIEANRLHAFGTFVECPGSTYTGHKYKVTPHEFIESGAETITLAPHYKQTTGTGAPNCKGPAGTSATVDFPTGCDYVAHLGETTGGVNGTYGVKFDVVCEHPATEEIKVTVWLSEAAHTAEPTSPKCILRVPDNAHNKELVGAHATDTGNGTVDLSGTVEGITVAQTRNSILCPSGTHTEIGQFDLDVSVTGHNKLGGATGISLSHN